MTDGLKKFTGKADVYSISRPGYPREFINYLYNEVGMSSGSSIADVGSGTGKFSVELLKRGSEVYCVEPNDDMRAVAERELSHYPNFHSINGTSEFTGLAENSIDFVTAAQAFHWFDAEKFKQECHRILKKDGRVILVWNTRVECKLTAANSAVFEKYCPEFNGFSGEKRDKGGVEAFFDGNFTQMKFDNPHFLNKELFIARCRSGSYSLKSDHPDYDEYIKALEDVFDEYSENEIIVIPNETTVYIQGKADL